MGGRIMGMSFRKGFLLFVLMAMSGWVGYWMGLQRLKIAFHNWRPDVMVNRETPAMLREPAEVDFSKFWSVWEKVNRLYVDKEKLAGEKMLDGAISGMVAAVGDPYTVYLTAEKNQESKEDLGGSFEGVGIQLGFKEKRLAVVAPLEGTPAKMAGVKAGDVILRITDQVKKVDRETEGMSLPEAVKIIRGEKGTRVMLTLFREGEEKPLEVELERDTIVVKSVTWEWLGTERGRVAWLKLVRFGDRTLEEWGEAVAEIESQCLPANGGCRGVVLDVRNNPGGYLEGAIYLAGEFLGAGKTVVIQQYGDGTQQENKVARNGRLLKTPLVVVVNEGSASAAEILAGALRDHRRAKVVGEKSFGKGSVQQPEDLPDGGGVHITVAKWLRPSGESIDEAGIVPDVEVTWDNGETDGDWTKDPQLVKAVEGL